MQITEVNIEDHWNKPIILGRQGENGYRKISFDVTSWATELTGGVFNVVAKLPGDLGAYVCETETVTSQDRTYVEWVLKLADMANSGEGFCEVRCKVGDVIAKTQEYKTVIAHSLGETTTPPAPWEGWVNAVLDAEQTVLEALKVDAAVRNVAVSSTTLAPGSQATVSATIDETIADNPILRIAFGIPKGATGDTGATGNGIASAVLNANYTLTLTFTDGTTYTTPPIRGQQGETGNGIASTVLNDDYTLTITFTDGTTYTTPSIRGQQGEQGEKGNVMFATFEIDIATGILSMNTDEEYTGANFRINDNGYLEVQI